VTNARANILRRLRDGAGTAAPPVAPDVDAYYRTHRAVQDAAARLSCFRAAMEAAHAEVHDTDADNWPTLIHRIAAAKGVHSLLVGAGTREAERLVYASSDDSPVVVPYAHSVDNWRDGLFADIDAGLSRARSAIAATGSLVLWTGPNEPRLLSLVPPIHFVLLDARRIHADLHEAMTAERWGDGLPTNVVVVSGPSKTADIQQTLAYGAHGPRELVVLLVHRAKSGT
jgi:L-lactate dehydrogenase complex protein LldG